MHPALNYAKQIAYSSEEVLMFSYEMAKKYANSPGVYCECGVAAGAQIIAMAAGAPDKTIFAFDSFEGICLPSNKDNQMPGIRFLSKEEQMALPDPGKQVLESSGATVVPVKDFWHHVGAAFGIEPTCLHEELGIYHLSGFDIKVRQGWFEETLPECSEEINSISILRLDGDLYNSTYICLKHLYPKVIKGGLVIVDDFALPGCKLALIEYFSEQMVAMDELNMKYMEGSDSTVAYWQKP